MTLEDRPTFKELCFTVSKFIEHLADYLQIGYNPFTGGIEKEKGIEEEEYEEDEGEKEEEAYSIAANDYL